MVDGGRISIQHEACVKYNIHLHSAKVTLANPKVGYESTPNMYQLSEKESVWLYKLK